MRDIFVGTKHHVHHIWCYIVWLCGFSFSLFSELYLMWMSLQLTNLTDSYTRGYAFLVSNVIHHTGMIFFQHSSLALTYSVSHHKPVFFMASLTFPGTNLVFSQTTAKNSPRWNGSREAASARVQTLPNSPPLPPAAMAGEHPLSHHCPAQAPPFPTRRASSPNSVVIHHVRLFLQWPLMTIWRSQMTLCDHASNESSPLH